MTKNVLYEPKLVLLNLFSIVHPLPVFASKHCRQISNSFQNLRSLGLLTEAAELGL